MLTLPFGSEFSPSQIELPWLLEATNNSEGDWQAFEDAVYERYFEAKPTNEENRRKLANNTKLSMSAYGIIKSTKDTHLTDFGEEIYTLRENKESLHKRLAKHILLNLHGLTLIETVKDAQASGEKVTLNKLREWLKDRGISFPRGGKHPSIMRLWLERVGVFESGWRVNQGKIDEILGIAEEDIEALSNLTREQRAFLRALANIGDTEPHYSNDIEKLAAITYGVRFDEKNLAKKVLYPLKEAGFIDLYKGTTGHGAKPFSVTPTAKLVAEVFEPILEQAEQWADKDLRQLLRKSLDEILSGLGAKSTYDKGLALEALAFKLMRLLDMTYVRTRLRGTATGGAEVDLVFESSRLVFSRWQIQCSAADIDVDSTATTVGLMPHFGAKVAIIVCLGTFTNKAIRYVKQVVDEAQKSIVLMTLEDLLAISNNPATLFHLIKHQAPLALVTAG